MPHFPHVRCLSRLAVLCALLFASPAFAGTSSISGDNYPFRTLTDMMAVDLGATYETMVEEARVQIASGESRYVELDFDEALERLDGGLAPMADGVAGWVEDKELDSGVESLAEAAVGAAATGRPALALAFYRLALDKAPSGRRAAILVNMAGLANTLGKPSEALALLREAEDEFDGLPSAALYANRGHALVLVRRYAEAETPLRQALFITPYLMEASRNLAIALALQGKKQAARQLMPAAVWRRSVREKFDYVAHGVKGDPFSEEHPVAIEVMAPGDVLDLSPGIRGKLPKLDFPFQHGHLAGWQARSMAELERAMAGQMAGMADLPPLLQAATDRPTDYSQSLATWLHDYLNERVFPRVGVDSGDFGSGEGAGPSSDVSAWKPVESEFERRAERLRPLLRDLAIAEVELNRAVEKHMDLVQQLEPVPGGERADANGCFPTDRRNADRLLSDISAPALAFDRALVRWHEAAHQEATGIAANLGDPAWRTLLDAEIRAWNDETQGFRVMNLGTALQLAVGVGSRCSLPEGLQPPEEPAEAPFCNEERQQYSFKFKISSIGSVEATCGKAKVVVEHDVIEKLIGVHAELELTAQGEVTVFAGPKFTAGVVELGPLSADFGFKDGLYITAGPQGVKDFGVRMVAGGGVNAGNYGATHDVGQVDISLNLSRADIVSAFTGASVAGPVDGSPAAGAP
ncbi:MAG: tetratricopeptide repeat protein [Rhizobium sp.]|nr:tetratricopeptide repeat protein [Rhizobium sp.]